jgi:hypothetical protein
MLKYILNLNLIYIKLRFNVYLFKIKYFLYNIVAQKKIRSFDLIYIKLTRNIYFLEIKLYLYNNLI